MKRIDSHMHISNDSPDVLAMLDDYNLRTINICVPGDNQGAWRKQAQAYRSVAQRNPQRFAWITGIDLPRFDDPNYCQSVIDQLEQDFSEGAIAVKVWKNVGMEVKKPNGGFLQIDDPLYQPIWDYLTDVNKPLIGHLAEPLRCWLPLDEGKPHSGYYKNNPHWHMYLKPDYPHHRDIIAARDNLLRRNPDLTFVGAHLGSLEYDLDEVAKRLDEFPKFVVDNSARCWDMASQPAEKVRAFMDRYQDRVLFGIDAGIPGGPLLRDETIVPSRIENCRIHYERDFKYFETDDIIDFYGMPCQGLNLSPSILQKFYWDNAQHWYQSPF